MELLETQDPEKRKLIETSARHKQELEREIKDVSERGERMLKNALIIGGVLAATYLLVSRVSSSKKKKRKVVKQAQPAVDHDTDQEEEPSAPSLLHGVGERLAGAATVFLMDLAKEKLSDYLKNKKADEHSEGSEYTK
ncbi:MAG: hypothetical protein JST43_09695 [Bacteroidetes bacterium]|nr:hypothetical protein [Bacteroidota bacterium]MBS1539120.1 hypothetical protein [Bacteroidota bacterium]